MIKLAQFARFNYKTLAELKAKISELKADIELTEDISPLLKKTRIGQYELPNAMVIHPMEGCDGTDDGRPSGLTHRRYERFGAGGAGLIWFEAAAVVPEGRSNPRQLCISKDNLHSLKDLLDAALKAAEQGMGKGHRPVTILQMTHSGRYSKPHGKAEPTFIFNDPLLDEKVGINDDCRPITDQELDELQERYVEAAQLAVEAGFDGIDIKACHRYLLSEILAGHTRAGKYGGSFENRTRFLLEVVQGIRSKVGSGPIISVRLNAHDGLPFPHGWGVEQVEGSEDIDLSEPKKLARQLYEKGVSLISVTAGNPYYKKPYIGRPFDVPVIGADQPLEHPLESAARLMYCANEIQKGVPQAAVVGAGYSWFRQYFANAAASQLSKGNVSLAGVGRMAFAYPDFAKDLMEKGRLEKSKVCTACSKCTQIMRDGGRTGCVIRDSEVYLPIYKEGRGLQGK
ncbi:NADH:flavin oxidoreductase [Desulfitibacter alkalitolerans]|uniref:oxidoreductase n=1 Tax=Desulfitibacter alkalitolerans TaxID=264641 RepID=UPI001FA6EA7C|nr:NADH:flavin oxidoreductase [Desulfitibacter alkalitolerans]